jgi:hypothetical protein
MGNISKNEHLINPLIVSFIKKGDYFSQALDEKKLQFSYVKITNAKIANNICSNYLSDEEQSKYSDWNIVLTDEVQKLKDKYEQEKEKDELDFFNEIYQYLDKSLNYQLSEKNGISKDITYLKDAIFGDFSFFIFKDFNNYENNLLDQMLQAYLAGGWPCGWEGEYPDGRLVIFSNE